MFSFLANLAGVIALLVEWGERERLRFGVAAGSLLTGFGAISAGGTGRDEEGKEEEEDEDEDEDDDDDDDEGELSLSEAEGLLIEVAPRVALESVDLAESDEILVGMEILAGFEKIPVLLPAAVSDSLLEEVSSEIDSGSGFLIGALSSESLDDELSEDDG